MVIVDRMLLFNMHFPYFPFTKPVLLNFHTVYQPSNILLLQTQRISIDALNVTSIGFPVSDAFFSQHMYLVSFIFFRYCDSLTTLKYNLHVHYISNSLLTLLGFQKRMAVKNHELF